MSDVQITRIRGNTEQSFGSVARLFHWLTALLILTSLPLGVVANRWPYDTAEALATKAQLFSLHKTLGVVVFCVALARILWAMTQPRPAPLHPDRKAELRLAELVHWLLYASLVIVPLSGWVHHAAVTGFAPILWPFGQDLPFVPKSEALGVAAGAAHWVFTKVLAAALLLHVVGAVKHHVVDRDATLRRMLRGEVAPANPRHPPRSGLPVALAFVLYTAAAGVAGLLVPQGGRMTAAAEPPMATAPQAEVAAPETAVIEARAGNWAVAEGTLAVTVRQMGQAVTGSFGTWQADITFEPELTDGRHGAVRVVIDTASLILGSVTAQAHGPEFLDTAQHGEAVFEADLLPAAKGDAGYLARGTLNLRGVTLPVEMPFTLRLEGDRAEMAGAVQLDRRDFGMGAAYGDEATVGFAVDIAVALVALRD